MMHHHAKFNRSEILSGKEFTEVPNPHRDHDLDHNKGTLFTPHSSLRTCTVKLGWSRKKKQDKKSKEKKKKSNANHILEVVMISSYEHKPSYCNLDLECMNLFLLHMTLCLIMMYHHTGFGYKIKGSAIQKVSSKLTFNHGCDIDLEHSNPIFSLIIFFAYDNLH